jgi:HAD superfamily hydrolase (TIGR01490 family)
MAGSSAFQWVRASYKAGLLSRRQLVSDAVANVRFRLAGSTDASTEALKLRVQRELEGVRVQDLRRLAPDVLAGILPRVYPQMLQIAFAHQDAGRPVYICTAASQELAELLARVLTLDGALGTRMAVADGRYTGELAGPMAYRQGKAQAVRELAEQEGLDLAQSWAYSDSESDLPMLCAVGHPVAVNPDAPLARVAREEGWEVIRFETLGRRLKLAGAVATALAAGGIGRAVARRGGAVRAPLPRPRRAAPAPRRLARR